jgi:hypothetical protein
MSLPAANPRGIWRPARRNGRPQCPTDLPSPARSPVARTCATRAAVPRTRGRSGLTTTALVGTGTRGGTTPRGAGSAPRCSPRNRSAAPGAGSRQRRSTTSFPSVVVARTNARTYRACACRATPARRCSTTVGGDRHDYDLTMVILHRYSWGGGSKVWEAAMVRACALLRDAEGFGGGGGRTRFGVRSPNVTRKRAKTPEIRGPKVARRRG